MLQVSDNRRFLVHDEPWLDFHTCQSGHKRNRENWRFIDEKEAYESIHLTLSLDGLRAQPVWKG